MCTAAVAVGRAIDDHYSNRRTGNVESKNNNNRFNPFASKSFAALAAADFCKILVSGVSRALNKHDDAAYAVGALCAYTLHVKCYAPREHPTIIYYIIIYESVVHT